jgi:hypothetical protein
VRDYRSGAGPAPDDARPGASEAMGMVLVAGVSRSWGVSPHHDGKTVWASVGRGTAG